MESFFQKQIIGVRKTDFCIAHPAHIPHIPTKKRTSQKNFFIFSIQKKLLISRTDYGLKFIRLLFFFGDLVTARRNSSRIVLAILGFANLINFPSGKCITNKEHTMTLLCISQLNLLKQTAYSYITICFSAVCKRKLQ